MKTTVTLAVAILAAGSAWAQDFQVGARAKGMGGSYTAFDDDPASVWMNPAGIATQSTQASIAYQSYTQYEYDDTNLATGIGDPEVGLIKPTLLPSFLGFVFQLGTPESPVAIGIAYVRPMHLALTFDQDPGGDDGSEFADISIRQQFSRMRFALGYDFRLRAVGEAGFLTHLALGGALDVGYSQWEGDFLIQDSVTGFGGGLGLLAGLYDNTENLKIAIGMAFQSGINFNFQNNTGLFPEFDWPALFTAGLTLYLFSGMPLRLTVDVQMVDWKNSISPSEDPVHEDFRSVTNLSFGMEYKIKLADDGSFLCYPRLGVRKVEAMWDDDVVQPGVGVTHLAIDTKDSSFTIVTNGFGLYWTTADGKSRGSDLGIEVGGDTWNFAFGYTHEW